MLYAVIGRPGFAALAFLALVGCGGSGGRVAVQGKVTLNGEAVDGGGISFIPAGDGPRATGEIVGGTFNIEAARGPAPGKHKVEIVWAKKTGKQVGTPGDAENKTDETKQVVPWKYNSESTLTAEVKSSGNTFDFDLKGDAPKGEKKPASAKAVGD